MMEVAKQTNDGKERLLILETLIKEYQKNEEVTKPKTQIRNYRELDKDINIYLNYILEQYNNKKIITSEVVYTNRMGCLF